MDIFTRIANADLSKLKDFGGPIGVGRSLLALKGYGERDTAEDGKIVAADFVVLESESHRAGEIVGIAWFVNKGSWKGEKELARALKFVRELCGADDSVTSDVIQSTARDLASKEQPGTGMQIESFGSKRTSKTTAKEFVEVSFRHVAQDAGTIAATRAKLSGAAPVAVPTPAPAPAAKPSLLGSLGK